MSNPSLILPQSPAYGEDYVYAAQVEDGAVPLYNVLPLTFTRASGGTRINKDGLVQNMPYNLNSYSDDFSTGWGGANKDYTADATTAPNGTTTADKLGATGGTAYYLKVITSSTGQNAFSIYLKYGNRTTQQIYAYASGSYFAQAVFNLQTGVVSSVFAGSATIEDIGNGWYRCTISGASGGTSIEIGIENISVNTYTYAWGAQVNIGSTAQPYLATTDRLNMPRITYPVGGGCGALLLEKQSTNLVTYSEDFTNADWNKNISVVANAIVSPDGTQNADKVLESASNVPQWAYQTLSLSGAQTATIYAKKAERNYIALATAGLDQTYFNLDTGVVVSTASGATASITSVGNGWYRCSVTSSTTTAPYFVVWISDNGSRSSYAGDTSKGVYLWGAQNEASSYATSYIPTTSTSATRVADVCSKTGISNLIGQTEGTLFVDVTGPSKTGDARYIGVSNGSDSNRILFYSSNLSTVSLYWQSPSGSGQINFTAINGRMKMAVGYKNNDFVVYCNGVLQTSTTSAPISMTLNTLFVGTYENITIPNSLDQSINEAIVYKTRLTNAELATLTTI